VTTILLARHGETDWNAAHRWQGWADRPLTARGREQARSLADALAALPLAAVYSSDLERARATAEIVAGRHGLLVTQDPRLREVDVGCFSGLTNAEVRERFPDAYERWYTGGEGWDDGESYAQMTERVLAAIHDIAGAMHGGHVAVIAHGGPIRALHAAAAGLTYAQQRQLERVVANASYSTLTVEDGVLRRV
jgi:broad specificity phosphatase PhoE